MKETCIVLCCFICALLLNNNCTSAQTVTGYCEVLQQPCNGDGKLVVTVTGGLTPPLNFYFMGVSHTNVNSDTDTLYNFSYHGIVNINYTVSVRVSDTYGNYGYIESGIEPPFTIDYPFDITNIVCPDIIGSCFLTINEGQPAANAEYFLWGDIFTSEGNPAYLPAGYYTAIVYDENECVYNLLDSIMIQYFSGIDITLESTPASCDNGTVSVTEISGGEAPYTYQWNNNSVDSLLTGLLGGYYTVTITDNQGCTQNKSENVQQIPEINCEFVTSYQTCSNNDGSITAYGSGGEPPYTYLWSNGATSQTISGIAAGFYYVTLTDANSCYTISNEYLNSNTPIYVNIETAYPDCNSASGTAELIIDGGTPPYDIQWATYPIQTGSSIAGLEPGMYPFTVTDQEGCVRTGSANVQQTDLTANISHTNAICPDNNGSLSINAYSANQPISYQWNTGGTLPQINNLAPGYYSCTITDANGCSLIKEKNIQSNSPITIGISSSPASCPYTPDGSATAYAIGGSAPYSFSWSNGQSGNSVTELTPGCYQLVVSDNNDCQKSAIIQIGYTNQNDDCFCIVTGTAFTDNNGNCVYDAGENTLQNIRINCNGFGSVFTNANGEYTFVLPGGNYTLSTSILGYYPLAECQEPTYNISVNPVSGCVITRDFALNVNPIRDVSTYFQYNTPPVVGNNYYQKIIVKNEGTIAESDIQLNYLHDGQLVFQNSSLASLQLNDPDNFPNLYESTSFPEMQPGQVLEFINTYFVPTNIAVNTEVLFSDTVSYESPMNTWNDDYSPWNNVDNYNTNVVCSYDPNNKQVSPSGEGEQGLIATNDSILTYTINFENTGNYYAQNIVLIDTLSENLDWTSLMPIHSSHNCEIHLSEEGILEFKFENIHLPYSGSGRFGYVMYQIKLKENLPVGTEILNSAAIYFDYNLPVITNTVINTIKSTDSNPELSLENNFTIYPNPTNEAFSVKGNNIESITLTNSLGQIVLKTTKTDNISVENLSPGIYFVTISAENSHKTVKLLKFD
ncbi:MAG: T9SS type A sorting domain-containing protein [Bacteroidales bacterium]|nr:T9SS type A sorting domain-containing protein [Bacteroidales bacterium]